MSHGNFILGEVIRTLLDLLPIVLIFAVFQFAVLKSPPAHSRRIVAGLLYTWAGLTLFRIGLGESLIPLGREMALRLFQHNGSAPPGSLRDMAPLFAFAGMIAFAATFIEPTLIAVGRQVQDLSGGALNSLALRAVIALGVAVGLMLGTARVLYGIRLELLILTVVAVLAVLAWFAPREFLPLSLDSGGMATSVVTVPLIAAYGLALAEAMPGRHPVPDGFGLIVLALLCPAAMLLVFATLQARLRRAPRTEE